MCSQLNNEMFLTERDVCFNSFSDKKVKLVKNRDINSDK